MSSVLKSFEPQESQEAAADPYPDLGVEPET